MNLTQKLFLIGLILITNILFYVFLQVNLTQQLFLIGLIGAASALLSIVSFFIFFM